MLPDKDPYPKATDWQALARLVSNIHASSDRRQPLPMGDTYFSHPFPQVLHSLVYSVMMGTCHEGMPYLTLMRRQSKPIFPLEKLGSFSKSFKFPLCGKFTDLNEYISRDISSHNQVTSTYIYVVKFFETVIFPYYNERLGSQCGITLTKIDSDEYTHFCIPCIDFDGDKISRHNDYNVIFNARMSVLVFLLNNVIFPTLESNGFTKAAQVFYEILVRDYGFPREWLTSVTYEITPQVGRKREIAGQKFGRLYVANQSDKASEGAGHVLWDCVCDCGKYVPGVESSDLIKWKYFSCGDCHLKSINESTLTKARNKAKQSFYGAQTSCQKRASDYSERCSTKEFYNAEEPNLEVFVAKKRRDLFSSIFLLQNPDVISVVAGLPLEGKEGTTFDNLNLHRVGHERLMVDTILMPYASSTIAWIPSDWNKGRMADAHLTPYVDGAPEVRAKAK